MSKCISGGDAYVEIRDNKVIAATYVFTIEIVVENVYMCAFRLATRIRTRDRNTKYTFTYNPKKLAIST